MKKVVLSLALVAMMFVSCKEAATETPVEEVAVEAAAEVVEEAAVVVDSAAAVVEEAAEVVETPAAH